MLPSKTANTNMMKHLAQFFLVAIVASCVIGTTASDAVADNYRAGEFTAIKAESPSAFSRGMNATHL